MPTRSCQKETNGKGIVLTRLLFAFEEIWAFKHPSFQFAPGNFNDSSFELEMWCFRVSFRARLIGQVD